ncbi:MAG: phosphate acyltransferase PlsX, partial [Bacillota bacterium]
MRIVIDAMGGDYAPEEILKGTVRAVNEFNDINCIVTGKSNKIKNILNSYNYNKEKIEVVNAEQEVTMMDKPSDVLRKKKDSSLIVGTNLVSDKKADAFISAGNTGAVMAAGIFKVGRIKD